MNHEPTVSERASAACASPAAPFPIAAEAPDAAPARGDDALRVALHLVALLAILALLAYTVVWAPSRSATPAAPARRAPHAAEAA